MATQLDKLVTHIAQCLVDQPKDVLVSTVNSNHTMVLELRVAKADIGKIIGRQGRTVHALRTLIAAVSSKIKKRTFLEIIE